MRQNHDKHHKSIRHPGGIRTVSQIVNTLVVAVMVLALGTTSAQTKTQTVEQATGASADSPADKPLTSEQILALFQREARAAYQMNKEACSTLSAEQKKVCLARARLQFDADMRYAQKRADQGY